MAAHRIVGTIYCLFCISFCNEYSIQFRKPNQIKWLDPRFLEEFIWAQSLWPSSYCSFIYGLCKSMCRMYGRLAYAEEYLRRQVYCRVSYCVKNNNNNNNNNNVQAYSCRETGTSLQSWGHNWGHRLKPVKHHGTIVTRGSRGALNWTPIYIFFSLGFTELASQYWIWRNS